MSGNGEANTAGQASGSEGNGGQESQEQGANGGSDGAGNEGQQQGNDGAGANDNLPGDASWPIEARQALRAVRDEAASTRTKLRDAEGKLTEAERAKLGDLERAQQERDEANAKAQAAEDALKARDAADAITAKADKFINPSVVAALVPPSKIEYDADGKPTNLDALVAEVGKKYPELLKKPGAFNGGDGQGAGSNRKTGSMNDIIRGGASKR